MSEINSLVEAIRHWQRSLQMGEYDPACEQLLNMRRHLCLRKQLRAREGATEQLIRALEAQAKVYSQFCPDMSQPPYL